jgi:hypothetical protein
MSSPPAGPIAQLFWETNNSGDFSETRSEVVTVIPDGKWRIYSFNVGANAAWSGLISQLRFDPIQSGGAGDYVDIAGISYLNKFPIVTKLSNISTRGLVQTGDNVLIGGLIISGNGPKQVILRALGPTLGQPPFNLPNALANPTLTLLDGAGNPVVTNDDWGFASNKQAIIDSGFAPPNSHESAVLANLNSGNYTAVVRGGSDSTGIALVEGYDLDPASESKFANISTRGFVGTGANVMIAGVIVGPDSENVIIRGLGPTLGQPPFNVPNVLANPFLDLRDANGNRIMANDNWKETQLSEIQASSYAPPNDAEAAILTTLPAGNYTALLSGVSNTSGNALVEVYALN